MGTPRYHQNISSPLNAFQDAHLVAFDFDGTAYDTFERSPNGIGVDEAYASAIPKTFPDDKDAVRRYYEQHGHDNRTPYEIVEAISSSNSPEEKEHQTVLLVAHKLTMLFGEVGQVMEDGAKWPRPMPGFIECWSAISEARAEGRLINTAFISSGHVLFIKRILHESGLEMPDILVTDETIRGLNSPLEPSRLAKPSALPLMLAKVQWLNMYGAWQSSEINSEEINSRITVVGDSREKDGGLAQNAGVRFIEITPETSFEAMQGLATSLGLGSFAVAKAAEVE